MSWVIFKVNELNKETDNGKEVSNVKLDSLISNPNGQQQGTTKAVSIRKEDTQLLVCQILFIISVWSPLTVPRIDFHVALA